MPVLRYLYIVALALWVGGTVVAGAAVVPALAGALQASDPVLGRVLAGQVFGTVLDRLHFVAYAAGGVMLVALSLQRLIGPRPVAFGVRAGITVIMLALALYSGRVLAPRMVTLGTTAAPAAETEDVRRVEVERLHHRSSNVMSLAAVGGLVLLLWEAREHA